MVSILQSPVHFRKIAASVRGELFRIKHSPLCVFAHVRYRFILLPFLLLPSCGVHHYVADDKYLGDPTARLEPDPTMVQRLFLIADAGDPAIDRQEPVLAALEKELSIEPEKNTVLFLGDNVYYHGLPAPDDPERALYERRLDEQIKIVERSGAQGIFIPGNHDWDKGANDGWDRVRYQADYISGKNNPRLLHLPLDGCPGPVVLNVGGHLRLVLLDTQWWLHEGPKPEGPASPCAEKSEQDLLESLGSAIRTAGGRKVIVAAHHPMVSRGPHGGFFTWVNHIFPLRDLESWLWIPLPGIGTLYPVSRWMGITPQDLSSSEYGHMISGIDSVLTVHPPLAYAAGHEHVLQVFRRPGKKFLDLVSGCGTSVHDSHVATTDATLFADPRPGFMRIDIRPGKVGLSVLQPSDKGEAVEVFRMEME